jgi:hypothetical protein
MNKPLEYHINKLPVSIVQHIFAFLIPCSSKIIFCNEKQNRDGYSLRYQEAFINDYIVENIDEYYLSRIVKKNNKHRYYITLECIDTIECEYNDREIILKKYEYISKYVGKNINIALFKLFYDYK